MLDERHRPRLPAFAASSNDTRAPDLDSTATPQRGDGQPLGNTFNMLVCGPSNRWLTDNGYLVPCEVLAPPDVLKTAWPATRVEMYRKHAPGTRAIVFASTVAEAQSLAGASRLPHALPATRRARKGNERRPGAKWRNESAYFGQRTTEGFDRHASKPWCSRGSVGLQACIYSASVAGCGPA